MDLNSLIVSTYLFLRFLPREFASQCNWFLGCMTSSKKLMIPKFIWCLTIPFKHLVYFYHRLPNSTTKSLGILKLAILGVCVSVTRSFHSPPPFRLYTVVGCRRQNKGDRNSTELFSKFCHSSVPLVCETKARFITKLNANIRGRICQFGARLDLTVINGPSRTFTQTTETSTYANLEISTTTSSSRY